jgi:hypothetical protein
MEDKKILKKKTGRKKKAGLLIVLSLVILGAVGLNFYMKYTREREKQLALEEQRRLEEAERERLRKLLEEKRKEFLALIGEMKQFFNRGNFAKVRELAENAYLLAREHGFDTSEIDRILHMREVRNYMSRLRDLKEKSKDIFLYSYVRSETLRIPGWPELAKMRNSILETTYENEYSVLLKLAREYAMKIKKDEMPKYNYMASKSFLDKGIILRKKRNLDASEDEYLIENLRNELFFASRKLPKDTIPPSIYH